MKPTAVVIVEVVNPSEGFRGYVTPKKRIEIHTHSVTRRGKSVNDGFLWGDLQRVKIFEIGDEAEYGSYNLTYTGYIKSITAKNIIISPMFNNNRTVRLKIGEFLWRNHDFDSEAVHRSNAEISMHI